MGKYEPLARFLKQAPDDVWDASFREIEDVLNFSLPPSARRHRAWWANGFRGNHSQAQGWVGAGWVTSEINLKDERIRFERTRRGGRAAHTLDHLDLRGEASRISGISDLQQLERAAYKSLIEREAALQLAQMGGSMPELAVPARQRPDI